MHRKLDKVEDDERKKERKLTTQRIKIKREKERLRIRSAAE